MACGESKHSKQFLNIQKTRHYSSNDADEVNIIAKIKNAFSKKDACYELISENFLNVIFRFKMYFREYNLLR